CMLRTCFTIRSRRRRRWAKWRASLTDISRMCCSLLPGMFPAPSSSPLVLPLHIPFANVQGRGRYDIDVYENSFRLRGKTYDYKIQYAHIKKIFSLPKPDDVHHMIVVGLEPPLRQGQTRYPVLVMQFKRDDDGETDLSMTEEMLVKYNGKLRLKYDQERYKTVTEVFHGLTGRKIVYPSVQFNSHHNQHGVKCSNKANEGHLFFLDKGLLFVPKPAVYMDLAK